MQPPQNVLTVQLHFAGPSVGVRQLARVLALLEVWSTAAQRHDFRLGVSYITGTWSSRQVRKMRDRGVSRPEKGEVLSSLLMEEILLHRPPSLSKTRYLNHLFDNAFSQAEISTTAVTSVNPGSVTITVAVFGIAYWLIDKTFGETVKEAWKESTLHCGLKKLLLRRLDPKDILPRRAVRNFLKHFKRVDAQPENGLLILHFEPFEAAVESPTGAVVSIGVQQTLRGRQHPRLIEPPALNTLPETPSEDAT